MSDATVTAPLKKLVLIDAYSLLFRAFFAGRPLSTRDKRPTGALYGFANMLFTILNNERPDSIIVCWDAPGPTLREQEFEAYKAHRPEVDPQLRAQFPIARDLVAAFGIASAELAGYEADDLIGTLAKHGAREGFAVTILTGDSDQLQLVGDKIWVQMTQRGVSEVKIYDAGAVRERYGVGPEGIPDWKALVGDTSDNIPGVPGIGEKTATALLQRWHSLENLLEHVVEVTPPKARANLEAHIEQARFSKRLATIACDAPIELTITPYAPTDQDWQNLRDLFVDLEFRSLLARIPMAGDAISSKRERNAFHAEAVRITSEAELRAAIAEARQSEWIAVMADAEGSLPMLANLHGIAFAWSSGRGYYVPVRVEPPADSKLDGLFGEEDLNPAQEDAFQASLEDFRALFETATPAKIGSNVKFVEIVLERAGLHPAPFVFDAQIAAYLLHAGRSAYPLLDLAEQHLEQAVEIEDSLSPESLAQQAALLVALVKPMRAALEKDGLTALMDEIEMPLIPALSAVEQTGLLIDRDYLAGLSKRMGEQMDARAEEIYALAGERFNIGSTKQLQTILFEKLKLPTGKKIKTGFSTGADLLEQLAAEHEIARKILDYREVAKLKSTYTDALPKLIHPQTGRIHTSLNQTVASTGRLSSSEPNLQNIPVRSEIGREIRRAFIAPPGKMLLSCDYSQIELRVLAHITGDPTLIDAFRQDADIHAATAAKVFHVPLDQVSADQRRQAKTINFAVIYGQGSFALAQTLGVETSTAKTWIEDYFAQLPGVKEYIEATEAQAHQTKYVTTLMGRRRYLPELDSSNYNLRQFAERAAVNMPIQGTAADIMKKAMIEVYAWLKEAGDIGCTLLLQVHDELLFEVEESVLEEVAREIVQRMERAFPMKVRLKVDAKVGPNWTDMTGIGHAA
jgi:DNA polymerase-1